MDEDPSSRQDADIELNVRLKSLEHQFRIKRASGPNSAGIKQIETAHVRVRTVAGQQQRIHINDDRRRCRLPTWRKSVDHLVQVLWLVNPETNPYPVGINGDACRPPEAVNFFQSSGTVTIPRQ